MASLSGFNRAVANMMRRYGTQAIVLIASQGTYDPDTSQTTSVDTEYTVNAIFVDFPLKMDGIGTEKGTLVQAGDKQCFIQPLNKSIPGATMPLPQANKDRVKVADKVYKIFRVKEVNPTMADSVVIECYLRE